MPKYNVIVVTGKSNSGKTSSLLIVIDKLIEIFENTYNEKQMRPNNIGGRDGKDKWIILEHNGKKIGILTQGDSEWHIKNGFDKKLGLCDYYIFAAHLYGDTLNPFINNTISDKRNCVFMNKVGLITDSVDEEEIMRLQHDDNEHFANMVIDLLFMMLL